MSDRPTPVTDFEKQTLEEFVKEYEGTLADHLEPWYLVHEVTSKKLERERDEARKMLVRSNHFLQQAEENLESIYKERDEAREAFRELWQSADAYIPSIDQEVVARWRKIAGLEGAE